MKKTIAIIGGILVIGLLSACKPAAEASADHANHVEPAVPTDHDDHAPEANAESGATEAAHDDHADHASHGASNAKLTLNDGEKWPTDEALRASMGRLHVAVIPPYKAFNAKTITAEQANELAATIKTEIDLIFANCKLEPKADAALHIVLADLLGGKAAIEKNPADPEGIPRIVNALHGYAEHFDHPNF